MSWSRIAKGTSSRVAATAGVAVAALVLGAAGGCSGSKGAKGDPVPTLAQSLDAQLAFQDIRSRWVLATRSERAALEPKVRAFRQRFAHDPVARVADAYLAFIALDRGDVEGARAAARHVRAGDPGNTRDLGVLIDGAALLRAGKPEAALERLEPLVGKMIDGFAQDLLHETVVAAAVDAHRWFQAVVYMNEWLRMADEQDKPSIRARLDTLFEKFPPNTLEASLRTVQNERDRDQWETELRASLATRLATIAMERGDPNLARSVLESSQLEDDLGDAGAGLAVLATSGGWSPRIIGARVGMLAQTGEAVRDRSADVIAGALEVFRPGRSRDIEPGAPGPQPPALITRDVGEEADVHAALDELAYEGAAVIIAGLDAKSAQAAAAYAETQSIPVVLLITPQQPRAGSRFTFVAGVEDTSWLAASATMEAARKAGHAHPLRIAAGQPAKDQEGASCEAPRGRAGESRFPVVAWKAAGVDAIAIDGSGWCARDVLQDLSRGQFRPPVFVGLDGRSSSFPSYPGGLFVATAGPWSRAAAHPTLRAWLASHGQEPSWFQALGRDAAQLALEAVARLPADTVTTLADVVKRRAAAQTSLASAETFLWTTDAKGFGGARTLARTVTYEPAP